MRNDFRAVVVVGLIGCGGSSSKPDARIDSAGGSDAATDSTSIDVPSAGTLTMTVSNGTGTNVATTSLVIGNLDVGNHGMGCNAATAPTLCSINEQDSSSAAGTVSFNSFQDIQSFNDNTSDTLIPGGSVSTGTAILYYLEDTKRWDAQSGTFTIVHRDGGVISVHFVGSMAPNGTAPGGATGTFTLDAVGDRIKIAP